MRVLVVGMALLAAVACSLGGAFACEDDAQCNDAGELGVCQAGGHCSFPDDACPSGQRYGQHSAGGFAGECVPTGADTDVTGGETSQASASEPDDGSANEDVASLDASSGSIDPTTTGAVVDDSEGGSEASSAESSGGSVELDPDLVLWLTFDDPQAPLADASIYARDVGCNRDDCPQIVADGVMDLAALFDGVDDLLVVPHDPALETDEGLTVAVRVRNDALSDLPIHTVIARPYAEITENSWELFFRDEDGDLVNDVVFEIADPGGQLQIIAPIPAGKGEWVRLAAVWTGDSIALYLDGVLQTEAAATGMLFDESSIAIGGDFDDLLPAHHLVGALDDVRVYRRALSAAEIAALL